jgi:hypothetical protein
MTFASVEPMKKPSRLRDFDKSTDKKQRRFKKKNVDSGKRSFLQDSQKEIRD